MAILRIYLFLDCFFLWGCATHHLHSANHRERSAGLRMDGLYVVHMATDEPNDAPAYSEYLRFFPDHSVVAVGSPSTPTDVVRWLDGHHRGLAHGRYTIKGAQISFSCVSAKGTVDYLGTISRNVLVLRSFSHINGASELSRFEFVALHLPGDN